MDMVLHRPLVTIMIATRDRVDELRRTLEELKSQEYQPLDMVVIDDGSREPVGQMVCELWPGATVVHHHESRGQCQRRNEGFSAARGEFILQLDDDCCFTEPTDLGHAVQYLVEHPQAGALVFDMYNGPLLPEDLPPPSSKAGCVPSFIGAAILFRASALAQVTGYRDFYEGQGEEDELALQLLSRAWPIVYCPSILTHHRLSKLNRNSVATWQRGLGNGVWTLILHLPVHRLPVEVGWKLMLGAWDAVRLGRFIPFAAAIARCVRGIRRVCSLRDSLSPIAMRRYDALRLHSLIAEPQFADPASPAMADYLGWWKRWRNRARDTSMWEKRATGKGSSNIVRYAHEFPRDRDGK